MRKWKKINGFLILFITFFSACAGFSSWNLNSSVKKDFEINLDNSGKKVAYFGSRYFTSIEGALKAAEEDPSANTVYVIPGTNPTITRSCTIASNDTLCIPYEDDQKNVHNYFSEKYNSEINGNSFADNEVSKYRKNLITLIDSTINIDGTLQIGGRTGGSSNQGATTGYYCDLLRKNSVLNVKGTLESYGFIHADDSSSNSASIINLGVFEDGKTKTSAVLKTPTVFYDYGSAGQIALLVTNKFGDIGGHKDQKVFPFEKFDVPQIRPTIKINYGSKLIGKVHTYGATAKDQTCEAGIVGEKDAFILLTEGSCLEWKYSDESKEITSNNGKLRSHKTEISIYGKALIGSLNVTVSGYNINSSEFYLPVPFGYYISLKNGCELEFPNSISGIKFMPGSCLTCEAGSQLNINTNTVFYQGLTSKDGSFTISYETSSPAKCLNSGTITINSGFEGVISTNQNKGKIITKENLQSVDNCKEVKFTEGILLPDATFYSYGWGGAKADFLKREFTFNGSIVEDEYASIGQRELAKNSVYQANKTNDGKCGWYNETYQSYGISFVLDDGDDVINPNGNSKHFNFYDNENVELEPLSNKDTNKTFDGFYYDSSLTDKLSCTSSGIYYVDPNYVKQKNYLGTEKFIKIYTKWISGYTLHYEYRKYSPNHLSKYEEVNRTEAVQKTESIDLNPDGAIKLSPDYYFECNGNNSSIPANQFTCYYDVVSSIQVVHRSSDDTSTTTNITSDNISNLSSWPTSDWKRGDTIDVIVSYTEEKKNTSLSISGTSKVAFGSTEKFTANGFDQNWFSQRSITLTTTWEHTDNYHHPLGSPNKALEFSDSNNVRTVKNKNTDSWRKNRTSENTIDYKVFYQNTLLGSSSKTFEHDDEW